MEKDIKDEILDLLEKRKELPSTSIAELLKENYWKIIICLNELEQENKIVRQSTKHHTYWRIK